MDKIIQGEGKKRRLPLWMLGVSTADQVEGSRNRKANSVSSIEKEEVAPECRPTKLRGRRKSAPCDNEVSAPCKDAFEEDQSKLVARRDIVKRKRKAGSKDVPNNGNDAEETVPKKSKHCRRQGRAAQKSAGWRRGKINGKGFDSSEDVETALSDEDDGRAFQISVCPRRGKTQSMEFESSKGIEAASPSEDDEDLTMDDLMSIAKEFVKDDEHMGQQSNLDAEEVDKPCAATSFSRNDPEGSLTAPELDRRSREHKETASGRDPAEITTSERTLGYPSSTGDPAQDMLDLFLGPLLKKPLKEQKKAEIITDDMIVAHEFRKQNQKVVIGDAAVPLTKKKTSLRDKVAMFLD